VVIQSRQFTPPELTVGVGEEVTWTNKDAPRVHSVTADDGSFDSSPDCSAGNPGACMDDRAQFSHVFPAEGRFPYYSRTHGGPGGQGTSGVIVVVPAVTAKQPPPPTTTTTTTSTPPPASAGPTRVLQKL
jgi:plastocyanin